MMISENTQLGLRFRDERVKLDFYRLLKNGFEKRFSSIEKIAEADNKEQLIKDEDFLIQFTKDKDNYLLETMMQVHEYLPNDKYQIIRNEDSKYFLICDSVYEAAKLIKIGENFTARTFKDVKLGHYTYLMGKHEMLKFRCGIGAIKGYYYNDEKENAFEWGLLIENGNYYFPKDSEKEFSRIMQVLAFVELGDIEVTIIEKGRNKEAKNKTDKVHNASNNTVYVVDSSWNKIVIRTEGFAVRGHFRLQPCGEGMRDRKLIWIDAFEKHGYKRTPKAEIVR